MTNLEQQIQQYAAEALEAHGLKLVSARLMGGARALTLQVLAENPDGTSPGIDTCAQASRTLAAQLDVAEVLNTRYMLEVSSPGLDRPLMKPEDYARFTGKQAKLSLISRLLFNESYVTTLIGTIVSTTADSFTFKVADTNTAPVTLKFADIKSAHLYPSTAELTEMMKQANMTYKEAPMGVDEQDFREPRAPREDREEDGEDRPRRPAGRPDFKRGNVMLNEKERKELGVMSDDEKIAEKTRRTQERYEKGGNPGNTGVAKKAWAERAGKASGETGPKKTYSKFGAAKAGAPTGRGKFSSKPSGGKPSGGRPGGAGGGFKKPSNRGR